MRRMPTPSTPRFGRQRRQQRGAAILLALIIVALITTTAAGMVWQQTRAVQVEAAERAREQSGWILSAAVDWARVLLREDLRAQRQYDAPGEPWSVPLAEARLSSFLAVDKDNNSDSGPDAFLSGDITDAQSRFNLRGLVDPASGQPVEAQVLALQRLADLAGAPADTAARIAAGLGRAQAQQSDAPGGAPIRPEMLADLVWLGIDQATLARLAPWVDLLPLPTPVNANTASREVLVAAIDGLDMGTAQRLVQARQNRVFESQAALIAQLPENLRADAARVGVSSSWFLARGRLRLEDRVLEERALLQRDSDKITVRRRERESFVTAARNGG